MTYTLDLIDRSLATREAYLNQPHDSAFRLFNGFQEGCPGLVMDIYATTLVIFNLAEPPELLQAIIPDGSRFVLEHLPWLKSALLKTHHAPLLKERRGLLLAGSEPDRKICEHGVWFAFDPLINQDASFYLDTRNLRKWIIQNLAGKSVLNTFAYTGSLGVAAMAGGASRVVHLDINRGFLDLAKSSYILNGFPINKIDFIAGDFWAQVGRMKRLGERFDCIFLDPPFFARSTRGRLDLNIDSARLINKVRPLINNNGWLITVNNALFVSGQEYMATLEALCADGYLKIMELIPVPEDITGFKETRRGSPLTDPSPFNHSTKIAILEVSRK